MYSESKFSRKYFVFLVVFLGLLSAFGPFVTDMYLPTLPSMAEVFDTTASQVQMGLATSMLGLAFGQIFFGPLSDKYGRKPILMWAMVLFSVATAVSLFSPDITFFNVCRFLQGLGGAGGIVLSRSISTDCYSGRELAKMLAIIGAVNGIAPVTAPVIGGLVAQAVGWKGIFMILLGIGLVILSLCFIFVESHPRHLRHDGRVVSLLSSFPKLICLRSFRLNVLLFGFANGVLFAYISSASFVVQNHFGFSELMFALVFGINAMGIGGGSALALRFRKLSNAALFGAGGILIVSIVQLAAHYLDDNFYIYESLTLVMLLFTGMIFTSATTFAMDEGREYVGSAAAVVGASGFLFGGIVSPLVGIGDILTTTLWTILVCAAVALAMSLLYKKMLRIREKRV